LHGHKNNKKSSRYTLYSKIKLNFDPICVFIILSSGGCIEVNRFGRCFTSGRPLPHRMRQEIIRMSLAGLRKTAISRRLGVSHACVTKIIARWDEREKNWS